ncbi:MAG: hypothetical protein ACRCXD_00975 [Luteolibacter sp.]
MNYLRSTIFGSFAILSLSISPSFAGTVESSVIETPTPAPSSDWVFQSTLYGWLPGLDGDVGVGGFEVGVDESFLDLLPDINMFAMLRFEARRAKWGVIADGFYVDLGTSANPPGSLYGSANLGLKQLLGELSIAYRVYENPSGFVDLYAGARYNGFKIDLGGSLNQPGIQTVSNSTSAQIVNTSEARAAAIAAPVAANYRAAATTERAAIEADLAADIQADVDAQVKEDVERRVNSILRENGIRQRDLTGGDFARNIKIVRDELTAATAELEVAKLRATVNASAQADIATAEAKVQKSEKNLAKAINGKLNTLPTSKSADLDWVDPIVGFRAQWNINEKWYLAGKSDIGGFGVGSELAWTLQATVGYNLNGKSSVELGYRYLHTDYDNDSVLYDVAEAGLYMSYNVSF